MMIGSHDIIQISLPAEICTLPQAESQHLVCSRGKLDIPTTHPPLGGLHCVGQMEYCVSASSSEGCKKAQRHPPPPLPRRQLPGRLHSCNLWSRPSNVRWCGYRKQRVTWETAHVSNPCRGAQSSKGLPAALCYGSCIPMDSSQMAPVCMHYTPGIKHPGTADKAVSMIPNKHMAVRLKEASTPTAQDICRDWQQLRRTTSANFL